MAGKSKGKDKNVSGATEHRVVPREGGKYYAIEMRLPGKSEWVSAGDSAPTREEAEQKVLNMAQGKTADGSMNVSEVPRSNGPMVFSPETSKEVMAKVAPKSTPAPAKKPAAPVKKGSNLGGLTTDAWVAKQKEKGLSDDEIKKAYEAEGWSSEGPKFKAALAKYSTPAPSSDAGNPPEDKSGEDKSTPSPEDKSTPSPEDKSTPYSADSEKAAKIGKYLARNMIEAYNNGDFGEKGSTGAKLNMGLYILNEIGARLVNASSVARGGQASVQSDWSKMKAGNEETNKAIRSYEKQYQAAQEELIASMGKEAWDDLPSKEKDSRTLELLQRKGIVTPQSLEGVATTKSEAADEGMKRIQEENKRYVIENRKLVTDTTAAYKARIAELQVAIRDLSRPDWDSYARAQNAYLGSLKGLAQAGATSTESLSMNKSFNDTLSVGASGGGNIGIAKLDVNLNNTSAWGNASAESTGKTNSINKDLVAYAEYPTAQAYAKAAKEKGEAVNKELIENIKQMIAWYEEQIKGYEQYLN